MDDDLQVDMERVLESIREADVVSILFTMFRKSLVIDVRPHHAEPPFVRIAPQSRGA